MKIWKKEIQLNILSNRNQQTMSEYLDIKFIEIKEDALVAEMLVSPRTRQPAGILHGGASCVLAETVASTAANFCVDDAHWCVGLEINTNHIRVKREGLIIATAKPFHLGKSTQVWGIEMRDEQANLTAISRLTVAVLKRK